eukprot:jgi/Chrzof1/7441/Cz02g24050.t1
MRPIAYCREVLENANELRVMLCKDKLMTSNSGTQKRGTTVLAACGIYVNDILDAVPIDKYFELFKPAGGGEGGFIRIGLDFVQDASQLASKQNAIANGLPAINGQSGDNTQAPKARKSGKRRAAWVVPLVLVSVAAAGVAGFFGWKTYEEKQKKNK